MDFLFFSFEYIITGISKMRNPNLFNKIKTSASG